MEELYDRFGRSAEVRADRANGSLLIYTSRPITCFPTKPLIVPVRSEIPNSIFVTQ